MASTPVRNNPSLQYVSPLGDDGCSGEDWIHAKQTIAAAYAALFAAGGGELHYAEESMGPLWIRDDGWSVPGWVQAMPLRLVGHGKSATQFGYSPVAQLKGAAGTGQGRLAPLIWIAGSNGTPITIEGVTPYLNICNTPFRFGWDYRRKNDATIAWETVTQWARSGPSGAGTAVLQVTLPEGLSISTAQRTSGTVRLTFSDLTPNVMPLSKYVQVTSTDSNYPSGTYEVTAYDETSHYLEYAQGTGDQALASNIGTWQSHGIQINDRIEVLSTDDQVPPSMYKVLDATVDTITVTDVYGYGSRSASTTRNYPTDGIVQYVLQDRHHYEAGLFDLVNCTAACTQIESSDRFETGPAVDQGSTADGRIRLIDTCMYGNSVGPSGINQIYDADRCCWLLMDGGSLGSPACQILHARPNGAGIRTYGATRSWGINITDAIGDQDIGQPSSPALEIIQGNAAGEIYVDTCYTADADIAVPSIKIDAGDPDFIRIENSRGVEGRAYVEGTPGWSGLTESQIAKGQFGSWAEGRISGEHPGTYRTILGLATSRYRNLINPDPSTWEYQSGFSFTAGQPDPMGSTGAILLSGSGHGIISLYDHSSGDLAAGDRFAFGCWVARTAGLVGGPTGSVLSVASNPSNGTFGPTAYPAFKGDGEWQWLSCYGEISQLDHADAYIVAAIGVDSQLTIFQPVFLRVPVADAVTDNEFAEFRATLRHQPGYLPAGTSGTMPGTKFVAHGGLGIASTVPLAAGPDEGDLTVGQVATYEPRYDETGAVLGWTPLYEAVINGSPETDGRHARLCHGCSRPNSDRNT